MDKVKQWKPGQLVTVKGKVYRVTKMHWRMYDDLCKGVPFWRTKLPNNCYLKKL